MIRELGPPPRPGEREGVRISQRRRAHERARSTCFGNDDENENLKSVVKTEGSPFSLTNTSSLYALSTQSMTQRSDTAHTLMINTVSHLNALTIIRQKATAHESEKDFGVSSSENFNRMRNLNVRRIHHTCPSGKQSTIAILTGVTTVLFLPRPCLNRQNDTLDSIQGRRESFVRVK